MGNADLVESLAVRCETAATVKADGRLLRIQHHFAVAAGAGRGDQAVEHLRTMAAAPHAVVDRHAADASHARRMLQQPAGGDALPQAVVDHRMHGRRIGLVPFLVFGHALLYHKDLAAQGLGIGLQAGPVAGFEPAGGTVRLEALEQAAQHDRNGRGQRWAASTQT